MDQKQSAVTNEAASKSDALSATRQQSAQEGPIAEPPYLFLQRLHATAGNRAASRWIQAKLKIGAPNDVYEQEADRVADQIMSNSGNRASVPQSIDSGNRTDGPHLRRQLFTDVSSSTYEEDESSQVPEPDDLGLQTKPVSEDSLQRKYSCEEEEEGYLQRKSSLSFPGVTAAPSSIVRRQCACGRDMEPYDDECAGCKKEREGHLQRAAASAARVDYAPPIVHEALRSSGLPLDRATRSFFEPRFGTHFNHVRIHDDQRAAEASEAVAARAFTVGSHIFFNRGEYQPQSFAGRALLAHELAHVEQGRARPAPLRRRPKSEVTLGQIETNPPEQQEKEEWVRLQVFATGMDHAAQVLAAGNLTLPGAENRNYVFIGLHPKFVKVYDKNGKPLGSKVALKEVKGLIFTPGVYLQGPQGSMVALTIARDEKTIDVESGKSEVGQRPFTAEQKAAMAEEEKKAKAEGREPKPLPKETLDIKDLLTEPDRFISMVHSIPDALAIYFVPTYKASAGGREGAEGLYASPIESRADGQPANAPPWPVSVDGPKLVPVDSTPTYSAKIDWTANGNFSLPSQVISQVGNTIHYRWELFDITKYAKKEIAKDPAGTHQTAAKPEKSLEERIQDFKKSKAGTGSDVTGMGGANREFSREFEDWWKDTKRAAKGAADPGGDTVREKLSNAVANRLSLELAPVTLLTTAVGAALRWVGELFAGPRQQQEINLKSEGIFLIRTITTPGINEDLQGNPVIRPPSVDAKVTEVTQMDRTVREALDEPGAQLAELQAQIDLAEAEGNKSKAGYLRSLLAEAKERFEGSPLSLLVKKRDEKQRELEKFRKEYPGLSDYTRAREVEMLDDQIALYEHHEKERTAGAVGLAPLKRVNATLISEVTGEQYPLLLSAGPMAMEGSKHQWMISDVTNREGDAFIGLGDTPSAALRSALTKFGGKAAYGRGRIGIRTAGLGLEANADSEILVDSEPADWALAEKRIDDLVTTLALLGLVVASAGTGAALIGAGVAAVRLIQRWQAGKLYLDAQTVSDVLGLLGGLGAAGQLAAGLRLQKFENVFAIMPEGQATESQIARAAEALKGAQQIAKAVEIANEAINYAGMLWGDVSFIDQMMSISDQERSGAITHAAARRARASAISAAVQNNGLFIAGNVLKAKQPTTKGRAPALVEKTTGTVETVPSEKVTSDESTRQGVDEQAGKLPRPEPVPIGERQATPAELRAALPSDLQELLYIDDSLHGDSVQVDYILDKETGLLSEILVRCSPDARPASVALHAETVRTMQKYQGFSGRVRQAISWIADLIGIKTLSPEKNPASFEAALEIQKLPKLIKGQIERMKTMQPNARDMAEAELDHLELQLDKHLRTLELNGMGEGAGFVAAKGLSKAKQKQYADLLAKLRTLEPGSDSHKDVRWEMYELIGGDLPFGTWEKIYASNVERAKIASAGVNAEHERLGWGKTEQTVQVGKDEVRRLDIADKEAKKGVEVKEYETGYIAASEDIVSEVTRDAKLARRGWDITWILVDTEPSGPLLEMLQNSRITIELRTRKGGGESEFVTKILPNVKARAKVTQ